MRAKMQCFICVTYMVILCSTTPSYAREIATVHEKRSLFRDVIESLRLHAHLPEDFNQNEDNSLPGNDDRFIYGNEPDHLPADVEYIPRRNDRNTPTALNYRLPKTIGFNENEDKITEKQRQEVVVYIDTDKDKTTQKPKKPKRPNPRPSKVKYPNRDNEEVATTDEIEQPDDNMPFSNTMAGQSQIGDRESQTVIKPTVIVNIRGSVSHRDSDIRLQRKQDNKTNSDMIPQNVFNINQEIRVQKDADAKKTPKSENVKNIEKITEKGEEDMLMCETATWKVDKVEDTRKFDNVFQILFNI